ncbi:MAG: DUF2752 domain-containing protein, partial [Planctomycetota bacterium]
NARATEGVVIEPGSVATTLLNVRSKGHWIFTTVAAASVLGLVVLRCFTTPDPQGHGTHQQLGLPPCSMMQLTGFPCPGCGVTTAASYLVHGDWKQAVVTQPFGALLAVGAVSIFLWAMIETLRGRDAYADFRRFVRPWMYVGLGVAMLAAWAYKIAALRG